MDTTSELATNEQYHDDELVAQARQGSTAAFDALYHRHKSFVYNVCYRMLGSADDAVDITQTAFVQAYRHLSRFRGDACFRTWLYRIAMNACTEQLRREQRRRFLSQKLDCTPTCDSADDRVWETMLQLSPDLRAVLVLFYFEQLSCSEISKALVCSEGAVRTRLHRARVAFKERYVGIDL